MKKISLQLKKHTGKNIPLPNASLKTAENCGFPQFSFHYVVCTIRRLIFLQPAGSS
ncbi:YoyE [Bacillus subtilis QB928]|nr:YoyE [Bacillus subtilis QB928]